MKRTAWILPALVLALALGSCSSPPAPEKPAGSWRLVASDLDLAFFGVDELRYLEFDPERPVVRAFGRLDPVELKGCTSAVVEASGPVLVFWPDQGALICRLGAAGPLDLGFAFAYRREGPALTISDSSGRSARFERVDRVPGAERCTPAALSEPVAVDPGVSLAYRSNLLSDGSTIWISGRDRKVYPVQPDSGQVGAGQTLTGSSYHHAVALQSGDFWAHCNCGFNEDIRRVRIGGTTVDTVDTQADLGHALRIRAAAWNGRLWLWGYDGDQERYAFLVVDSDAEPDGLEQVLPFDAHGLRNLTFHDGALWGLFRFAGWQLAELDPAAGKVVRSYTLPRPHGYDAYLGLASLNGRIYLIAEKGDAYELYSVAP
ncbi:hypothetical protein [Oceanithermus sp.]